MSGPVTGFVPTRFLLLSDTHNFDVEDPALKDHPLNHPRPTTDVVLHCGDLTHCGGASSYRKAIKLLASIDAELKLVIAGNHDLDLDKAFWDTHLDEGDDPEDHDEAMAVMKGNLAQDAGIVYLDEGTHSFTLKNGARLRIYVSPYTPAFNDWAFAYEHHEDRFNKPQDILADSISTAASIVTCDLSSSQNESKLAKAEGPRWKREETGTKMTRSHLCPLFFPRRPSGDNRPRSP